MNCYGIFAFSFLLMSGTHNLTSSGQENTQQSQMDYSKGAQENIRVPRDVTLIAENAMPEDKSYSYAGVNDSTDSRKRGIRFFSVQLNPGEQVKLSLKAMPPDSYFLNWLLPRDNSHPLYSKIKRDMDNQLKAKRTVLSLKNTAPDPCEVYFWLSGLADNKYSIKVDRK
ncbi:MAG: hypothetical protein FWG02_01770 [Holophagaceae bacterium]|nr:hypothetical protein [Holophagaceae bacterium]